MKAIAAAALLLSIAAATQLSLTATDCGHGATKAKIISFTPSSVTLGQKTTLIGTGDLSEDVSGAAYDLTTTGFIGQLLHCTGDAAASKTCGLPMGVGSLTFDAMNFPIAAGKVSVRVDLLLNSFLPGALLNTKTVAKATASNGDQLFCLEISTAPMADLQPALTVQNQAFLSVPDASTVVPAAAVELASTVTASQLSLTARDCGHGATKAKIIGFTPSSITLGQKTTLIGTGDLSEGVSGASYDLTMTGAIGQLLHCTGNAAASKTCGLPMGVGSLTFDAMNFPIAPGKVSVRVELFLRTFVPGALLNTKTIAKATASNGDQLFCLEISSAPTADFHPALTVQNQPALPAPDASAMVPAAAVELESAVAATQLSLTATDCGHGATKAKIIGFTPASITLGQKTTLIGTGDLSEGVSGASYDLTMTGAIGQLLHCTGDAAASKTCGLPMGVGSLTFDAMNFPIAPGKVSVRVELFLRTFVPGALLNTKTIAKATASNGDQLFCLEISSAPASNSQPALAEIMV